MKIKSNLESMWIFLFFWTTIAIYIVNHMLAGTRTYFFEIKRKLLIWAGWTIGKGTKIVGPIYVTSDLEIGENTWVGKNFMCTGGVNRKLL